MVPGYPFVFERVLHIFHKVNEDGDWIVFRPKGAYPPERDKVHKHPGYLGHFMRLTDGNTIAMHLDMKTKLKDNIVIFNWEEIVAPGWDVMVTDYTITLTEKRWDPIVMAYTNRQLRALIARVHRAIEQYHMYIEATNKQPWRAT